jgi:hypothetical protein
VTEFLSKLSGQIIGPMILGTLFPVLLFFTVVCLIVLPITPFGHEFTDLVSNPYHWDNSAKVALIATFVILVTTVVLYHLSNPLIRLYEGYPWKDSLIGRRKTDKKKKQFELACNLKRRTEILAREDRVRGLGIDSGWLWQVPDLAGELIDQHYPNRVDLVLPTRLGNVIRAFETYTERRYGASTIALWPRLQGVMEPSYTTALDNTKVAFDFMLNCSFLSFVSMFLLLGSGLYWKHPKLHGLFQPWEIGVIVLAILSYLLYLGAINRAAEWGIGVKAAFDLYRLPLLTKLGYETKPSDLPEERRMWDIISYHFAFPSDESYPELPYRLTTTSLLVEPSSALLEFQRSVSSVAADTIEIRVTVSNHDPDATNASAVSIREEKPVNWDYVNGSATVAGTPAVLLSVEPLVVQVGPLNHSQSRVVAYRLRKQPHP